MRHTDVPAAPLAASLSTPPDPWRAFADAVHAGHPVSALPAGEWRDLFGPLVATDGAPTIVAQLGQSIDGRIATRSGHSKYINGHQGLLHLHRLRALCDGVMVGISTVIADDPLLNVRHCFGVHPHRIVIDPNGRLPRSARLLDGSDGARRIVVTGLGTRNDLPDDVEIVRLPVDNGFMAPAAIAEALGRLGLRRVLLEGGAHTISSFLSARMVHRLHVIVAPVILGDGRAGFALPPIERVDQALRPPTRIHPLDGEVLFDCDLSGYIGRANTST